jgi:ATP-dependent Clp protease protease subunit
VAGTKSYDIFYRLMKERIVFVGTTIDDTIANLISAQLLCLQLEDPKKDISFYVNSPGGSVIASLAIYDTMQLVENDVATYAIGQAGGTGLLLCAAGTKGKRFALRHARFMFMSIWGGRGESSDERARASREVYDILARHTGQPFEAVEQASEAQRGFGAGEAVKLGVVDAVLADVPGPTK